MSRKILRGTKQRDAIKRSLDESIRPLGPKEILKIASGHVPNLGIATVYRNIKFMVARGDLETVEVPGQAPRYQPPGNGQLPRFVCTKCDRVFNLNGKIQYPKTKTPNGMKIERQEVILYGIRTECKIKKNCPFR